MSNITIPNVGVDESPTVNTTKIYAKVDGLFYIKDDGIPIGPLGLVDQSSPNLFGNSTFKIDQEGNAGGVAVSGAYVLDMWQLTVILTAGASTLSRSTTVRTNSLSEFSLQLSAAGNSYVGVNDTDFIVYKIEGTLVRELMQGFTISFWAMSDVTGQYAFSIRQGTPLESYVVPLDLVANIWQHFSIVVPAPIQLPGLTTAASFFLSWNIGAGSTPQTPTANTWHTGNFLSLTTSNPLVTGNFYMAEPMISRNLSTFQPNLYSVDLAWAHRYFERKTTDAGSTFANFSFVHATGTTSADGVFQFSEKRVNPTVTAAAFGNFEIAYTTGPATPLTALSFFNPGNFSSLVRGTYTGPGPAVGSAGILRAANSATAYMQASARL